jgi:hypothetical protein
MHHLYGNARDRAEGVPAMGDGCYTAVECIVKAVPGDVVAAPLVTLGG